MKRLLTALLFGLLGCSLAVAKPVKNVDQAVDLVKKSIIKNKLTTLEPECLLFYEGGNEIYYQIDIREKHNKKCGGDLEIAGRLFTYTVDKKTGSLKTDAIATPCYINELGNQLHHCRGEKGEYLVPIDPVSPIIIYDPPRNK
ncbi:hypothetical protein [Rodentibacter pneumotropicus]|uniref:hypothetical protein n=1 Tax=Rodentibacter pneumotropicus TaxID=758 RepID=UPI001864CEE5|nr:hypothetical protein [Rodentibacter pneumotropicus]